MNALERLDVSDVRAMLNYNPLTGAFTWKPRNPSLFANARLGDMWNRRYALKIAGTLTKSSTGYAYVMLCIKGIKVPAHRVAWLMMTGESPGGEVDHVDRDATNNAWKNLRLSDRFKNSKNRSMNHNNTSGVTGVYWVKSKGCWSAKVQVDGKSTFLGYFDKGDIDLAAMAVLEFRKENGFDEGHGIAVSRYRRGDFE